MGDSIREILNVIKPYVLGWSGGYTAGSWTPTLTGFSGTPTVNCRYTRVGSLVTCSVNVTGTSNATGLTISLPFTARTLAGATWENLVAKGQDNSAALSSPGYGYVSSAGTVITCCKTMTGGAASWTAAGTKEVDFTFIYEAA